MKKALSIIALVAMTILPAKAQNAAAGFRGPNRDGQFPESGLLKQWPENGPQVLWENLDLGKGYSSATAVGDRIYVTGMTEDQKQETFMALDKNGKILYTTVYGRPWKDSYPETRTTPTIHNGKAFVISGAGDVVCIDVKDGKIIWKVDGTATYKSTTGNWGTAECPLVFDGKVIYTPGGNTTTMVALDENTGKEVWKSRSLREARGYVSPTLIEWKGKKQIVGSTISTVIGVNPDNGEIMWTFNDWGRAGGENIPPNSALFKDGKIFFSQGYDIGGHMLQLSDDMRSVKRIWKTDELDTHHGGYVLVNGVIYGSNWLNNNAGNWCAIDWETGKTLYSTAWSGKGKGSIIYADGLLYCYDERRGTIGIVVPDGKQFKTISEVRVNKGSGPFWAHLSIYDGVMYARHGEALIAYKIK
ncbi:MAG: PQQ-binding-like beta-propeller repeat protein [Bacteroidales bacterium]|nr:PQQ-binding-like beta-propeller repeat protein [Bacteroidales bacterium]